MPVKKVNVKWGALTLLGWHHNRVLAWPRLLSLLPGHLRVTSADALFVLACGLSVLWHAQNKQLLGQPRNFFFLLFFFFVLILPWALS